MKKEKIGLEEGNTSSTDKTMDPDELEMVDTLCITNPEIFNHYFRDLSEGEHEQHERAIEIYNRYGLQSPFECFVARYRQHRTNEAQSRKEAAVQTAPVEPGSFAHSRQVSSGMDVEELLPFRKRKRSARESWNEGEPSWAGPEEDLCKPYIYDPAARRHYSINPFFRNTRRKEEFDAVEFLADRKKQQKYYTLTFESEEDIEIEWASMRSDPDRKRIELLADGVLRKIAEHLENLNRVNNYSMLVVHYEKKR